MHHREGNFESSKLSLSLSGVKVPTISSKHHTSASSKARQNPSQPRYTFM